jgi:phosphatidylserine/phosphatidylglycerophosphate/cardiolipin synthase-like enzyme
MAKFLNTEAVTYRINEIINNAQERLILISPYLQINDKIRDNLQYKNNFKIDIRIIYGKSELQPSELNWIKSLDSIRTSYYKNLHAKCYLNEKEAVITSMNLFEYSQVNNYEMGIYLDRSIDTDIFQDMYNEVSKILANSKEIKISVDEVEVKPTKNKISQSNNNGFCIRCHSEIKLNPMTPYCKSCYNSWKKFENIDYEEKYCHICGKEQKSSLSKPTCYKCYKANKDKLEFPVFKS